MIETLMLFYTYCGASSLRGSLLARLQAVQPYFDVGFPHGEDQWISACGTSWATMALALAAPETHAVTAQVVK